MASSFVLDLVLMIIAFAIGVYFMKRSNFTNPQGMAFLVVGAIALIVGLILLLALAGVGFF